MGSICTRELNIVTLSSKLVTVLPAGSGPGPTLADLCLGVIQDSASWPSPKQCQQLFREFNRLSSQIPASLQRSGIAQFTAVTGFCPLYWITCQNAAIFYFLSWDLLWLLLTLADIFFPRLGSNCKLSWTNYANLINLFKNLRPRHVFETSYLSYFSLFW